MFQFHKGAIRTVNDTLTSCSLSSFNSIKVQLEQILDILTCGIFRFQFHKGAIRTLSVIMFKTTYFSFNSIKVQLELVTLKNVCSAEIVSIP